MKAAFKSYDNKHLGYLNEEEFKSKYGLPFCLILSYTMICIFNSSLTLHFNFDGKI